MKHLSPQVQECIHNCQQCHATCLSMATVHCLELGGEHVEPHHFRLMLDCAQICQVSADFMLRASPHHPHVCRECAEICTQCAENCERIGDMEECVEACRACATTCQEMAAMAA